MTWNLFCDHSKRREDWERSIFVRLKEGGYRLRENILFHLYVSTSPCGDARLNSPYEITTDCKKKKNSLSFFPFAWFFSFLFLLRSVLLSFFVCLQKMFLLRAETLRAVWCVCVGATGAWSRVWDKGVQGKLELGKAAGGCSACLRLSGFAREYVPSSLHFLLGNATPTVNKCLGKGPHDQRDPWSQVMGWTRGSGL